jgi:glucose-1-phosphate adenylyltransferase
VEILAAQQTLTNTSWYEGTADAVRKNLTHFLNHDFDHLLILSGDQLYRMDFRQIIAQHVETGADITVATIPVGAQGGEIARHHADRRRPAHHALRRKNRRTRRCSTRCGCRRNCKKTGNQRRRRKIPGLDGHLRFQPRFICELLDNPLSDFGKHIIPHAINSHRVFSYIFQGYWEDIGTIRSFFEANLDLVSELPRFNFFDMSAPIFSRPRFLPGSKINGAQIDHALVTDGCIINHARIKNTIIGLRTVVGAGTELNRVIILGSDYYESEESIQSTSARASRASASARIARSRTPSLTRTRASETT